MTQRGEEDQIMLVSQLYPDLYNQVVSQQESAKVTRRRRRRSKGEASGEAAAAKKRKLSEEQVNFLELSFENEHKLESERKDRLASELGLDPRQVAVWFQNRRARWKSKKMEEEYSKLKTAHESVVMEKHQLQAEVLKLKEQLSDAEKEVQRLSERGDVASSNSSGSSHEIMDPDFFGAPFESIFYVPMESSYTNQDMDWVNLYGM